MANKIIAVLRHPPLQRVLRQQGQIELRKLSWKDSARKCKEIYEQLINANTKEDASRDAVSPQTPMA